MSESLFWQDGFPKERRIDLVAALLYAKDPNARIPGDEGLRPDRVDDFYHTVRFTSAADFEARMEEVEGKYRYSNIAVEAKTARALPSADPFEQFFGKPESEGSAVEMPVAEASVVEAPKRRAPRVSVPRAEVPKQTIVTVPVSRFEPVRETLVLEPSVVKVADPDASDSAPLLHAEDRVSALARSALAWFRGDRSVQVSAESSADDAVDPSRLREVVSGLFSKELGVDVFENGVHDPKALAHLEAAKRLERAITTSRGLDAKTRTAMQKRLEALRATYQDQMATLASQRRAELQGELDEGIAGTGGDDHSALKLLAHHIEPIAGECTVFRSGVEHVALQRGGADAVAAIDDAFRHAWQGAWRGPVTPSAIGPLEGALAGLRLIEGRGAARLVAEARLSVQDSIDRELPKIERAMKRAA